MLFNATPVGTDFTDTGTNTYAYVVTNGQVGGINVPTAAPGNVDPGPVVDRLAAQLDDRIADVPVPEPDHQHGPARGRCHERHASWSSRRSRSRSSIVSLQNPEPQTLYPLAYSPTGGPIDQVPAPEPATVLAWAGVIAAWPSAGGSAAGSSGLTVLQESTSSRLVS